MSDAAAIKSRFRRRLQAADARRNDRRRRLLEEGTRALQPVLGVLVAMAQVLDEEGNVHGRIGGLNADVDAEEFVRVTVSLESASAASHRLVFRYGPVLGGMNFIAVSGLGNRFKERLQPTACAASSSIGRSVADDIHLDESRGEELAGIVRDLVEEFYAGETAAGWAEPPQTPGEPQARLRVVQ